MPPCPWTFNNTSVTLFNEDNQALYSRELLITCDPSNLNQIPIKIHNHAMIPVSFRVGKEVIQSEDGHEVYFSYGGVDYGVDDFSSDGNGETIAANDTLKGENGFMAYFNPNGVDNNQILTTVKYKFFNRSAGNDANYLTLIYNPSGVGFSELEGVSISDAYPNPAVDHFNLDYSLPHFTQAWVKIYHLNGSLINQFPIETEKGSIKIPTQDWITGVYFYSIELDGKTIGVEKILVQ
ncbi:MAG: hypothetical protein B7C24_15930 [Bacteroidetes bacterium 4572_77]|nr:MAG: hypothetical protein B7C24_15930 [Bacteroidetes bacterium 4572_77]